MGAYGDLSINLFEISARYAHIILSLWAFIPMSLQWGHCHCGSSVFFVSSARYALNCLLRSSSRRR